MTAVEEIKCEVEPEVEESLQVEKCSIPVDKPEVCPDFDLASGEDLTSAKNKGILKQIQKEGVPEDKPFHGDTVYVHYTGWLTNGTKFDSSRDRGEQFSFKLGEGQVIKGWDDGVKSMNRGECARFILRPSYGYGNKGSPPTIPGGAVLVFDIELFSFEGEDLSEAKDKSIVRRILDKGFAYTPPNEGSRVVVNIRGLFTDGKCFDQREKLEFEIGDSDGKNIPEGLEFALTKMKKKENALIYLKASRAFGAEGCEKLKVPPNTDVKYDVTLTEFENAKEPWQLNWEEKLKQSEIMKAKGTDLFKQGKYVLAVKKYKKIPEYLAEEVFDLEKDKEYADKLQLAAHLNLSMCNLKLKNYNESRDNCKKVLEFDAKNEKGLFRMGQSYMGMGDFEEAIKFFEKVTEVNADNKDAPNQIVSCRQKIKESKTKEKALYSKMMSAFSS